MNISTAERSAYHRSFSMAYTRFLRTLNICWSASIASSSDELDLSVIDPESLIWLMVGPAKNNRPPELRRHLAHVCNVIYRISHGPLHLAIQKVLTSHVTADGQANERLREVFQYTSGPVSLIQRRRALELFYSSTRLNGKSHLEKLGIPRWIFSPVAPQPYRGITWIRLWIVVWDVMRMHEWCDKLFVVLGVDDRVQIIDILHQRLMVLSAVVNDSFDITMLEREAELLQLSG